MDIDSEFPSENFYQLSRHFLIVATLLYPIVAFVIGEIQENNLSLRTQELIEGIETSPNFRTLIERLKQKEKYLFFRVTPPRCNGDFAIRFTPTITGFNPEERVGLKSIKPSKRKRVMMSVTLVFLVRKWPTWRALLKLKGSLTF